MPYRFKIEEPVEKGFRRIAREQLDLALTELAAPQVLPKGVHECRKALKRLRALVRLASSDYVGICAAIRAIGELKSKIHIALAIDLATLMRLDGSLPVAEGMGLVLDGVNATTPLSALILDSIEAVRFEVAFIAAASRSLRIDAALRAMLFLANDLALSTLASEAIPSSSLLSPGPVFDYVLSEDGAPLIIHHAKTRLAADIDPKAARRAT